MEENQRIWRDYYEKALSRPHLKRTEFAVNLNESNCKVAVDCGCGTGSDIAYLASQGYQVHGFDVNPDSTSICRDRFGGESLIEIYDASFERFDYPKAGIIIANSSLFFGEPSLINQTWQRIEAALEVGGVFAGDFMGFKDSWAAGFRSQTSPLLESQVRTFFERFKIVRFFERDEVAKTSLGKLKHWHTYSVVAIKRAS